MMQSYPKEIATAVPGASDGSAADPGAEAARHWCSLAALQEDEREATLRLYDAMAEKMETWLDFGQIFMGFYGIYWRFSWDFLGIL
jgi:hypothetical protein